MHYEIFIHVGAPHGDYGTAWMRLATRSTRSAAELLFKQKEEAGHWVRMFRGKDLGRLVKDNRQTERMVA